MLITFESKSCLKLIKDNFCIPLIKEEFQFIAVPREMAQVIYINFDFLWSEIEKYLLKIGKICTYIDIRWKTPVFYSILAKTAQYL